MNGLPNLPSGVYNGGAVTFNSLPYTQFYLNAINRKRAKEEALDNYFRDFNKSINPAGMRSQDIEGWMGKVNDWRGFYQQNKQAIQNPRLDNGRAYSEYMGRFQDLNSDVQRSKNAADVSKQYVVPIITNPDRKSRLGTNGVNAIHAHDLSIYDQNHKELDPSVFDYSAKPFTVADQKVFDEYLTDGMNMSVTIPSYTTDKNGKVRIESYHSEYSPKDLQIIGKRATDLYNSDDKFQNEIDQLAHNQVAISKYHDIFKKVYGMDMLTNEDLAAAYGLSRIQQSMDEQKSRTYSPFTPYDYEALREKYFDYAQAGQQQLANNSIDELVEGLKRSANAWNSYVVPVDGATLKNMHTEQLIYSPESNLFIPQSRDSNTGQIVNGTPMTEDSFKAFLGKRNVGSKYFQKKTTGQTQQKTEVKKESSMQLSTNPSDWKKEGNNWRYKDGTLYDSNGNVIKQK